jgi:hypothetical protein
MDVRQDFLAFDGESSTRTACSSPMLSVEQWPPGNRFGTPIHLHVSKVLFSKNQGMFLENFVHVGRLFCRHGQDDTCL